MPWAQRLLWRPRAAVSTEIAPGGHALPWAQRLLLEPVLIAPEEH